MFQTGTRAVSGGFHCPFLRKIHKNLKLPNKEKLPLQGAMFIGEKGRLLLPHFMELPRLIVNGEYEELDLSSLEESGKITNKPIRNYAGESHLHYHQCKSQLDSD